MATFVLVHGAWVGGWAWTHVADFLIARGHRVFAPTLSGLGERSHLADRNIDLTTHVNDIVNEIRWKDLEDIVLAGHSYGGFVITGVAEQILERIALIVYVDAFVPSDGQSFADVMPYWDFSGTTIPAFPSGPDDYPCKADRVWVDSKATPHPTASFKEKLRVTGAYKRVPKKAYVLATGWEGFQKTAEPLRSEPGWRIHEVDCSHDIPIIRPKELADILEASA
jgi:pimeloyl-ACP methyl ester carboxylesterase